MIRLLATWRWLGYLALTVVFACVAALFGLWQWERREAAVAAIEILESNWDLPPAELNSVLVDGFTSTKEWVPLVYGKGNKASDMAMEKVVEALTKHDFKVGYRAETAY